MNKFLCLLSLVVLSSCAQMSFVGQDNESNSKYKITQVENPKANHWQGSGKIKIEYKDYAELSAKAEEKIKNEMMNEKDATELRNSIPKGGYAYIHIFRITIDTAKLNSFNYVVMKNGKEWFRYTGGSGASARDNIPSTPSHVGVDGRWWTNLDLIRFPEELKSGDSIQVIAMDTIVGGRDEFTIGLNPIVKK